MSRREFRFGNNLDLKQRWITIACLVVLQLGSALTHDISCDVTCDSARKVYIYRVPQVDADNCEFSWANMSDHVLANQDGKLDGRVGRYNLTTLELSEDLELRYKRSCVSEVMKREANCTPTCPMNFVDPGEKAAPRHHWIVALPVLLLLLLGLVYRYCICRNKRSPSEDSIADEEKAQL